MTHLRARRHLAAFHDGTLPAQTQARVAAHAESCPRCRRVMAEYAAMDGLLRSLPTPFLPAQDAAGSEGRLGLLARLAARGRGPWFERLPIHPLGAVTTAAALLLAVFLLTPPFEVESAEPFNAVVIASAAPPAGPSLRPRRNWSPARVVPPSTDSDSYLLPAAAY